MSGVSAWAKTQSCHEGTVKGGAFKMKGLQVAIAAGGLLIGLSVISYTQQAGVPPGGVTAGSGSAPQSGTGPVNRGGVVVRRAPGTGDGERDEAVPRSGNSRCKTQIYQVPSEEKGNLTSIGVTRC